MQLWELEAAWWRRVGRDAVLRIHTPVPAGNETFGRDLVTRLLGRWVADARVEPAELRTSNFAPEPSRTVAALEVISPAMTFTVEATPL